MMSLTPAQALESLLVGRDDDVAIALSPTLSARDAACIARDVARRLDNAGVPPDQRAWMIAASNDEQTARLLSEIADAISDSPVILHDPHDPDALVFQRRTPGQRRGGVYLNAVWQNASVRIAIGAALDLVEGLSGWFNQRAILRADDLRATLLLEEPPL